MYVTIDAKALSLSIAFCLLDSDPSRVLLQYSRLHVLWYLTSFEWNPMPSCRIRAASLIFPPELSYSQLTSATSLRFFVLRFLLQNIHIWGWTPDDMVGLNGQTGRKRGFKQRTQSHGCVCNWRDVLRAHSARATINVWWYCKNDSPKGMCICKGGTHCVWHISRRSVNQKFRAWGTWKLSSSIPNNRTKPASTHWFPSSSTVGIVQNCPVEVSQRRMEIIHVCTCNGRTWSLHRYVYNTKNELIQQREEDKLYSRHEEADTRVIYHVDFITKESLEYPTVVVRSCDTDVFVILLHHADTIGANLWMDTGVSSKNTRRVINISQLATTLTPLVWRALPAFHAFTGCDFTASFVRKAKAGPYMNLWWKMNDFYLHFHCMGLQKR